MLNVVNRHGLATAGLVTPAGSGSKAHKNVI